MDQSVNHVSVFWWAEEVQWFFVRKLIEADETDDFCLKTNPFIMSSLELPLIIKPLDTFSGILLWEKKHIVMKKKVSFEGP